MREWEVCWNFETRKVRWISERRRLVGNFEPEMVWGIYEWGNSEIRRMGYFEWVSARGNFELVTVWRIFDWSGGFCYCLVANWFLTLLGPPHVLHIAFQAPLSIGFLRQEYWSVLPFPSPGILRTQGSNQSFLHWQVDSLPLSHLGNHERRWWQGILREGMWEGILRGESEWTAVLYLYGKLNVCQNEKPLWV